MQSPSISVVVVNYNNFLLLQKCLQSVYTSDVNPLEVIVVDNQSTEGDVKTVLADYPRVRLIKLQQNKGFSQATNVGIEKASGELVFLLNNDTALVGTGWSMVVERFLAEPHLAALQPKIMIAEKSIINNVGLSVNYLGISWNASYLEPVESVVVGSELAAFSGAAVILRVAAVREVGMFDHRYFMYHEDVDLSCRLRLGGWLIMSIPKLEVNHHYLYKRASKRFYYLERNRLCTTIKCFPLVLLIVVFPVFIFMEAGIICYSIANRWFWQKIRSYLDTIRLLPHVLSSRFGHPRRISVREFTKLLVGNVTFLEVQNPLLDRIANPVLLAYRRLLKVIFLW